MNNKTKAGGSLALTDEERLLVSRAAELSARPRFPAVASCFLTPREQRLIFEASGVPDFFYFGGAVGATRRKLIFLPEWLECDALRPKSPFTAETEKEFLTSLEGYGMESLVWELMSVVRIKTSGYERVSHRDLLGALMALGIKRETLGDICFFRGDAYVFCENVTADYICEELRKAGRDTVSAEKCTLPENFEIIHQFEEISTTVASPRLDGVVRALCSISREDAAALVEGGSVELNYFTECECDEKVSGGDIISVRGYGKYVIDSADDVTRKGRIRLGARKYI